MTALAIRPCRRADAIAFVREHHSHHRRGIAPADVFRLGAYLDGARVAVALMGEATAPGLSSSEVWEVTRVCVGPGAPRYTASRILGACGRVMDGAGVQLGISYTRVDERGSSYLASGWVPAALVKGRPHTSGNRALRMLPGLYEPSTEIVDRVRWERGPRGSRLPGARWDERSSRWTAATRDRGTRGVPIARSEAGQGIRTLDFNLGKGGAPERIASVSSDFPERDDGA